ncbi:hypothetical protein KL86CLO1_11666 [uncultured Eubacteriales bacterium]|uniref:Uncharacterized protein n=1 Tax=uncultured Eubacteriales bacterium TaxID=172733 RepID=A0A212JSZ9_9FIRM|nr:hypothetical protein KL86CLO1_11666 [uncultured Eubacteriales bacterium]
MNTMFDSMDDQDKYPAAYDANGDEIWPGEETINYEGKEIVWETFRDEINSLIQTKAGALDLARALDLDVMGYE